MVSLANNHIFDYGVEGFIDTVGFLKEQKIFYCGAGLNIKEASKPCIIEKDNIKIGIIACGWDLIQCIPASVNSPGVNILNLENVLSQIKNIRKEVDLLITFIHWGYEFEIYPLPIHKNLARKMVDSGVDIIVGSHPHVVQGCEKYNNKFIFYSLGNFFFPDTYYGNKKIDFKKKTGEYNIPFGGLVIKLAINDDLDDLRCEFYKTEYNIDDNGIYSIEINNFDEDFLSFWQKLNEPLLLEDRNYIVYFKRYRLRKRGLPIFRGDNMDKYRIMLFKIREIVVYLRNKFLKYIKNYIIREK